MSESDGFAFLVTGKDECLKAVRTNIRDGADCIKFHATGGAASVNDEIDAQQFSDEEMKVIVDEANRLKRSCAAHCHGREGLAAAINAGVHTIEHGSWLDEELAKRMRQNGQMLVPTRYIVEFCAEQVLSGELEVRCNVNRLFAEKTF